MIVRKTEDYYYGGVIMVMIAYDVDYEVRERDVDDDDVNEKGAAGDEETYRHFSRICFLVLGLS